MKEFRNVTPTQLTLDNGFKVDPFQFTGSIDETLPTTAARVADGSLKVVPNGTAAAVGGGPALPIASGGGRLTAIKNGTAPGSVAIASNTPADLAGFSPPPFTYSGRPVIIRASMPLKFSVANASLQLKVVDIASGKQVYTEMQVAPGVANTTFNGTVESDPITAFADGTPLVPGQQYQFKLQIQGPAGNYQVPVAANSEFYGHIGVYEV